MVASDDSVIHASYGDAEYAVTGRAGDLVVQDTAGFHKGTLGHRQSTAPYFRLNMRSPRLGASYQYPLLSEEHKPSGVPDPTYAVFAE